MLPELTGIEPRFIRPSCLLEDDNPPPLTIERKSAQEREAEAPVERAKMMLGPRRLRLAPAGDVLMFGEGIRELSCRDAGEGARNRACP
jgi:hypothetical protein